MAARVAAAVFALLLVAPTAAAASTPPAAFAPPEPPPELTAASWLLYDATAGVTLASHNAAEPRAMASVTKMMTALVARERTALDEIVAVSEGAAGTGEAEIGLVPGEQWTMRNLIGAILVRSGNDAAVAIAEHVGGSVEGFAALMNARAAELGLTATQFTNPHGLDEEGHFSSAEDLLVVAQVLLDDPVLARFVRTRVIRFRPDPEGKSRRAVNTNALLGSYPGVAGIKTGFTGQAGRVLVATATLGGRTLITVVMGSENHFADTRRLLEYGFDAYNPPVLLRAATAAEQGGGGGDVGPVPDWLAVRLAAAPAVDDGRWAVSPFGATPAERALRERLAALLPAFVGEGGP